MSKSAFMNTRLNFNFIDMIQEKRILMKQFWVLSCLMVVFKIFLYVGKT